MMTNNQVSKLNQLLNKETEIGSANKPPLLTNPDDYYSWVYRFKNYLNFIDIRLWRSIEDGPHVPKDPESKEPLTEAE